MNLGERCPPRNPIEINDSLVQGMSAAKWSLETGKVETGKQILEQTLGQAHDLVSDLIRRAGMGARTQPLQTHARPPHDGSTPPFFWLCAQWLSQVVRGAILGGRRKESR